MELEVKQSKKLRAEVKSKGKTAVQSSAKKPTKKKDGFSAKTFVTAQ